MAFSNNNKKVKLEKEDLTLLYCMSSEALRQFVSARAIYCTESVGRVLRCSSCFFDFAGVRAPAQERMYSTIVRVLSLHTRGGGG